VTFGRGSLALRLHCFSALRGRVKFFLKIIKASGKSWFDHNAFRLSAALSFYTIFALGPILIVSVAIAGLIFGKEAASGELMTQVSGLIGAQGADVIQKLIASTNYTRSNVIASIVGIVTMLLGATGVFVELRSDLNYLWDVPQKKNVSGLRSLARSQLLSFALVVSIGFLLLVSLTVSALLAALDKYFSFYLPAPSVVLYVLSNLVSFLLITVLFALMFRVLPNVRLRWRSLVVGSATTALLFTIGKLAIGLYLGRSAVASMYGASASVLIVLIWTYYSAMILFFGACVTRALGESRGTWLVAAKAK